MIITKSKNCKKLDIFFILTTKMTQSARTKTKKITEFLL